MTVSVSYSLAALHGASKYIWENNPSVKHWLPEPKSVFDVMTQIRSLMHRGAMDNANLIRREQQLSVKFENEWINYTGTGGYYALYELQSDEDAEDIVIHATILVDPGVGEPLPGFVTEVIDGSEEVV